MKDKPIICAAILAAGLGTRMAQSNIPKQFLKLGDEALLVHTVEKFVLHPNISKTVVVLPRMWEGHAKVLFSNKSYFQDLLFCVGGGSRQESLFLGCNLIKKQFGGDTLVISHDAARPFVTRSHY